MIGGDIFMAIDNALDLFEEKYGQNKTQKKIYVLTSGSGKTAYQQRHIEILSKRCNSNNCKTNIIAIDFYDELDGNYYDDQIKPNIEQLPMINGIQLKNKEKIDLFCKLSTAKAFSTNVALHIYKQFRKADPKPTVKYSGSFEIYKNLKIRIVAYNKTVKQYKSQMSLKEYSLLAKPSKSDQEGLIRNETFHYLYDDSKMQPIDKEQKIRSFYYGKQLIPISKPLEDNLKMETDRCVKLLGFADSSQIPRHYFMSGCDILLTKNDHKDDKQALASLIHALFELDKVAICRYVTRKNSQPKLVCMIPHIDADYECFYVNQLPTSEDIRDYQFPSLKTSTKVQQKAAEIFIDSLDLMNVEQETGDVYESLQPEICFNPILQHFYDCLLSRAIDNQEKLPNVSKAIDDYARPDKSLFQDASDAILAFQKLFDLKEKEKDKSGNLSKVCWKDIILKEQSILEQKHQNLMTRASLAGIKGKPQQDMIPEEEEDIKKISMVNPINDFKKMLDLNKENITEQAFNQIATITKRMIEDSYKGNYYEKAIKLMIEFRLQSIEKKVPQLFNSYIKEIKSLYQDGNHAEIWDKILVEKITLISSSEFKGIQITSEQAAQFLLLRDKIGKEMEIEKNVEEDLMDGIE